MLVGPCEQLIEPPIDVRALRRTRACDHLQNFGRLRGHSGDLDLARQTVEGNEVAFLDGFPADAEMFGVLFNLERPTAHDGWLAHRAAYDASMRGHATGGGQHSL